ncbi:hypothetical protein JVU11DRAFT_6929 [Chiua virens]|nr:hypothetical protein JVU11DRAFT_6929 [Chiua virens]
MDHEGNSQPSMAHSLGGEYTGSQPEHLQVVTPAPGDGNGASGHDNGLRHSGSGSTVERRLLNPSEGRADGLLVTRIPTLNAPQFLHLPLRVAERGHARVSSRRQTFGASAVGLPPMAPHASTSGLDWIVPVDEKGDMKRTVGERLQPTIDNAVIERDKYARTALWTGYAINIAIGLQVLLGALTTGLSAAVTTAKQAQVSTAVLGGLATIVASYLARSRWAFQIDHAHEYATPQNQLGERLDNLRRRFEELLGNADGVRKLSPTGITPTQTV